MLSSGIVLPRMTYGTAGELDLYPCVSSCVFNGLALSLQNIAHPNFYLVSQRHRCAFRSPVLRPIFPEIHLAFFFFLH